MWVTAESLIGLYHDEIGLNNTLQCMANILQRDRKKGGWGIFEGGGMKRVSMKTA